MTKNGTRLTNDWQPNDKTRLDLIAQGLTVGQVDWLLLQFIDYFTGPDANRPVKKDWDRAFKNWAERDAWRAKKAVPQQKESPTSGGDTLNQWRWRMESWVKSKFWPVFAGPKPNEAGNWVPKEILREFKLI